MGRRAALWECAPLRAVGGTMEAGRLAEIPARRARRLGGNNRRYAKLIEVYEELEAAEALHRRLGCPVVEISELSIEETAARVIRMTEQRRAEAPATAGSRSRRCRSGAGPSGGEFSASRSSSSTASSRRSG